MNLGAAMRGEDSQQDQMFSYVSLESRVPQTHPLREVGVMVAAALNLMSRHFTNLYSREGRPSIEPERLLRALLLQAFHSIRSERLLIEELEYNLLCRWFVGLSAAEPVRERSTFSKNQERLLVGAITHRFFERGRSQSQAAGLASDEHFRADRKLIEAWTSQRSFRREDGSDDDNPDGSGRNAGRNFHGGTRSNETHE